MGRSQKTQGPAHTNRMLGDLNFAINEAWLVGKIVDLSDQLRAVEYQPDSAIQVKILRQEITDLELQLSDIRARCS